MSSLPPCACLEITPVGRALLHNNVKYLFKNKTIITPPPPHIILVIVFQRYVFVWMDEVEDQSGSFIHCLSLMRKPSNSGGVHLQMLSAVSQGHRAASTRASPLEGLGQWENI